MIRKTVILLFLFFFFFLVNANAVFAKVENETCDLKSILPRHGCDTGLYCKPLDNDPNQATCEISTADSIFGKIQAPAPLADFLKKNPTGGGAISQFLSNGITLIYSVAGIVLIIMFLWGAFEWMTSGGDKEKLAGAQKRIFSAIIGILLFAVAFAVIQVLGQFTGFEFFSGS